MRCVGAATVRTASCSVMAVMLGEIDIILLHDTFLCQRKTGGGRATNDQFACQL